MDSVGPKPPREALVGMGTSVDAVPVTELTENFSPMLRIAPPPFGKLTEGNGFLAFRLPPSSDVCACEVLLVWPAWPDEAAPNGAGIGRESIELCPTHEICFAVNEEQYFAKYKPQTSSAACGIAMVFAHSQSTYTTTRPSTWAFKHASAIMHMGLSCLVKIPVSQCTASEPV